MEDLNQISPQMEVPLCIWYPWLVGRIVVLVSVFGWLIVAVQLLSHVQLFVTPWTVACQDPLFLGFFRQEYWSGLPFPSSGYLPDPGIEPASPELAGGFFTTEPPGKPPSACDLMYYIYLKISWVHRLG